MKIRVNGKDHALSFGPQVALSDVLRDHLLLTGTKKSRDRQYMTDAETQTGTQTFPFLGHHGVKRTHGSAVQEWQPHRPAGRPIGRVVESHRGGPAIRPARATSCPGP